MYQKPTAGMSRMPVDIDSIARGMQRSTKAVGGYWTATFDVMERDVTPIELRNFFDGWLGNVMREYTAGMMTWEGIVYSMNLVIGGAEYFISLEPEWFHNKTQVFYSASAVVDTEQGALSYTDEAGDETFTDAGQDFNDWKTTAGDAGYRIQIANSNDTTTWAYLGDVVSATEIRVYTDIALTTVGWNEQDPSGLTPETYSVISVSLENSRAKTDVSDNTDSQAQFGVMEYIVSLAGASVTAAEAMRDRHLDEFGWPRERFINQGNPSPAILSVTLAGFWYTLFWRYRQTSRTAQASILIAALANASEFVTSGLIDDNTLEVKADAYPIPQRLGDLIQRVTAHGDVSGNQYRCGVYANQKLNYLQVSQTVQYFSRGGQLLDKAGSPVIAEFVLPGMLVQAPAPVRTTPPDGQTWDEVGITYVDTVEFSRDTGELRLSLSGEPFSVMTLQKQITGGSAE
jgi:hypothetical protein